MYLDVFYLNLSLISNTNVKGIVQTEQLCAAFKENELC